MTLKFPNLIRYYEEREHGVLFWGYDETIEISFLVEEAALSKINSETRPDEDGFLHTFDINRERIHKVAESTYLQQRKRSRIFFYTLTDSYF